VSTDEESATGAEEEVDEDEEEHTASSTADEELPPPQSLGTRTPCAPGATKGSVMPTSGPVGRAAGIACAAEMEADEAEAAAPATAPLAAAPRLAQSLGLSANNIQLRKLATAPLDFAEDETPGALPGGRAAPRAPTSDWAATAPVPAKTAVAPGLELPAPARHAPPAAVVSARLPTPVDVRRTPTEASAIFQPEQQRTAAVADAGLMFGRSFRVCWGPGDTLVTVGAPGRCVCFSCGGR